ncbi:hypothetical protein [Paenibacillus aestuarii]|uniref:Uncharacterized protein n=1 Tax=Paenibacillus aestuarii TaxID=516965 RepID=A0ABW0K2S7_9BACL|nr:hypothetical protein [Paenibacillus aestuarii]
MTNDITFAVVQNTDMEHIAQMINSNQAYNLMENGNALRSREEIAEQFDPADPQISYLIQ